MQKLELLSPAKNIQTAIAAINCGADAVYIAAASYGARSQAGNSLEDIKKLCDWAHLFNVKVYITLNTILKDDELEDCRKLIFDLYEAGADAIIVQDFAILNMAANAKIPPIAIHISTQCDNRDEKKVKFFEQIGAKRVILARELSLDEIKKISQNTSAQLEHFVHGALCVSFSGQCYMSCYIGKRSANRGCCAQACRKKYSLVDKSGKYLIKNKYLLSLKDNNLSKHLEKLIKAGIMSFKIEGRLKDENYVKNITLFYHNLLKGYPRQSHGKIFFDFSANPNKTFNRLYCDDYLFSKKDNIYNFLTPKSMGEFLGPVSKSGQNYFIIKTKEKISPSDGLCFILNDGLHGCLVNKAENSKESVKIYPNKNLKIPSGTEIYRNIDTVFNKTLKNSKTVRKLSVNFYVFSNKIEVRDENSNKASFSFDNFELAQNKEKMIENYKKSLSKTTDTPYIVEKIEFMEENTAFLPVSEINSIRKKLLDELSQKILSKYKRKKQKPLSIAQYPAKKGDYRLNVYNNQAKEFYEICGCKVEEGAFESIKNYSDKELMRTKHCLKRASIGCSASQELFLEDENGLKFPLVFDCKNCQMAILAPSKP